MSTGSSVQDDRLWLHMPQYHFLVTLQWTLYRACDFSPALCARTPNTKLWRTRVITNTITTTTIADTVRRSLAVIVSKKWKCCGKQYHRLSQNSGCNIRMIKLSENIQRRSTKMVKALAGKMYEVMLRSLGLLNPEKRRPYGSLQFLGGGAEGHRWALLSGDREWRWAASGEDQVEDWGKVLPQNLFGHGHRLPRVVVTALNLLEFVKIEQCSQT